MNKLIKQRNIFIDFLKAFAIILVVLGHNIQYGSGENFLNEELFYDNILFKCIYSFHMPLFMLISGYLFAFGVSKDTKSIIINKFRSLVIPILVWSFVSLIIYIVTKVYQNDFSILSTIKYYIIHSIYSLWFLWSVFYNSLIVIAVNRLFKESIIVYIIIFILFFILPDNYNLYLYKWMFPFFVFGYLYKKNNLQKKLSEVYSNNCFVFIIGALFMLLLIFYKCEMYIYVSKYTIIGKDIIHQLYIDFYRYLIGLVGSIFALVILNKLYKLSIINKMLNQDNFILTIGRSTMGIYIITNFINIYILCKITKFLTCPNYLVIIFETIVVLFVSIIFIKLIQRNNILNRYLLGAKY